MHTCFETFTWMTPPRGFIKCADVDICHYHIYKLFGEHFSVAGDNLFILKESWW